MNTKIVNLSHSELKSINGGGEIQDAGEYIGEKIGSFIIKYVGGYLIGRYFKK